MGADNRFPEGEPSCHDPYLRCTFFGAAQTAAGVSNACVLAHSPQGCELLVNAALSWQQTDYLATKTLCTKLCEDEIVHGGDTTLARVIEEAKTFDVPVVFVLAACGPEIVGDDIAAVCQDMSGQVPFSLVPMECAGFRGSQYEGIDIALEAILKEIPGMSLPGRTRVPGGNASKIPNSVVLIAPHASGNPSWPGDLAWVESVLKRLGATVVCSLTHRTPIEDITRCPRAEYSLLLSHNSGFSAEAYLEKQWGVRPLLVDLPLPIGFTNTGRWLARLGKQLGREREAAEIADKGEAFAVEQLRRQGLEIQFFSGARVAIMADATLAVPLFGAACEDLECEPVTVGIRSEHPRALTLLASESLRIGLDCRAHAGVDVYEVKRLLEDERPDAVIGSNIEKHLAEELGLRHAFRVVDPVSRFRLSNRRYFGYQGFLNIMEIIQNDWWDGWRSKQPRYKTLW